MKTLHFKFLYVELNQGDKAAVPVIDPTKGMLVFISIIHSICIIVFIRLIHWLYFNFQYQVFFHHALDFFAFNVITFL